jgi:hypothetical protein
MRGIERVFAAILLAGAVAGAAAFSFMVGHTPDVLTQFGLPSQGSPRIVEIAPLPGLGGVTLHAASAPRTGSGTGILANAKPLTIARLAPLPHLVTPRTKPAAAHPSPAAPSPAAPEPTAPIAPVPTPTPVAPAPAPAPTPAAPAAPSAPAPVTPVTPVTPPVETPPKTPSPLPPSKQPIPAPPTPVTLLPLPPRTGAPTPTPVPAPTPPLPVDGAPAPGSGDGNG